MLTETIQKYVDVKEREKIKELKNAEKESKIRKNNSFRLVLLTAIQSMTEKIKNQNSSQVDKSLIDWVEGKQDVENMLL